MTPKNENSFYVFQTFSPGMKISPDTKSGLKKLVVQCLNETLCFVSCLVLAADLLLRINHPHDTNYLRQVFLQPTN